MAEYSNQQSVQVAVDVDDSTDLDQQSADSPWARRVEPGTFPPGVVAFTVDAKAASGRPGARVDLGGMFGGMNKNVPEALRRAAILKQITVLGVVTNPVYPGNSRAVVTCGGTCEIDASNIEGERACAGDLLVADLPRFGEEGKNPPAGHASVDRCRELDGLYRLQPRVQGELNPAADLIAALNASKENPNVFHELIGESTPEADAWLAVVSALETSYSVYAIQGILSALLTFGYFKPTKKFLNTMPGASGHGTGASVVQEVKQVIGDANATKAQRKRMADIVVANLGSFLKLGDSSVHNSNPSAAQADALNIRAMAVQQGFLSPDVDHGRVNLAHEIGLSNGGQVAVTEHMGRTRDNRIADNVFGAALQLQHSHFTKAVGALVDAVHGDQKLVIGRVVDVNGARLSVKVGRS